MTIQANFPAIKPSLLLDFANVKELDPRITFTRSSTATYFDNNGVLQTALSGIPRFDHNPITGESLGLLIEEQRTNLLTYSEQFDNAAWTKSATTITANTVVAPDGTLTGDKLVEDTANAVHTIAMAAVSISASTTYSCTTYVKRAAGNRDLSLQCNLTGGTTGAGFVWFDLATGTASSATTLVGTFTAVSAQATAVGNGWYRCVFTFTSNTGNTSASITIGAYNAARSYAGDGTSGIYIWGAQIEAGAFATSYIPTVASQVTRSTDAASMTGTNFSSWYNASEGTIFAEASTFSNDAVDKFIANINNNGFPNRILLIFTSVNNFNASIVSNSVSQVSGNNGTAVLLNAPVKMCFATKQNNFAWSKAATTPSTDLLGDMPVTVDRLWIGSAITSSFLNGYVRSIMYYPRRLSNTELQAITG